MNFAQGLARLTNGKKTIGVTCLQWGDTGREKSLTCWRVGRTSLSADLRAKCGPFNLVEVGQLRLSSCSLRNSVDSEGKINVIGGGTAIDPKILCEELGLLESQGLTYKNLQLSLAAKLTLPSQIARDRVGEDQSGGGRIGTTVRRDRSDLR